jgi:hypothetical protein
MTRYSNAAMPNVALDSLSILIGEWETKGSHPMLPGIELRGHVSFTWIDGGAFLRMQSSIEHKDFPDGIAIFGSGNAAENYWMLYFDERNVSRHYLSSMQKNTLQWWRDDEEFAQRFTAEISVDGNTINSTGEMRKNLGAWEKDLGLVYRRVG